jgi:BRCT domain type II-containing protein
MQSTKSEEEKKMKRKGKRTNKNSEKNKSSRPKTKIQTPSPTISHSLPHKDFDDKIPNKPLPNSLMLFKSPNANPNPQELQLRILDSPPSFPQTMISLNHKLSPR